MKNAASVPPSLWVPVDLNWRVAGLKGVGGIRQVVDQGARGAGHLSIASTEGTAGNGAGPSASTASAVDAVLTPRVAHFALMAPRHRAFT